MKVLLTGANGFIGQQLCAELLRYGHWVRGAIRKDAERLAKADEVEYVVVGSIDAGTVWPPALMGCDAIVHLAARVHVMHDEASDPLTEFRELNTEGTLNLARQAVQAGVKRLVFVSSIKVNGEGRDDPYRETDAPSPEDAYAISKWEAEQGLQQIMRETGLEVVVLRPPLVYGPGVKANFLRLMQLIQKGWPLPLGAVKNRRSLLYVGNFVDAIRVCVEHPAARGQTFLLDDGQAVSTPELIRAIANAFNRPARLLPVPICMLQLAGLMTGRSTAISRLTGSLYVDAQAIRSQLDWRPPYSMETGLEQTVAALVQDSATPRSTVKSNK